MSEPFWTPLGGQPVDYEGAWAAGTQYAPGDVVTYNGVNYLAVNPSLGVVPAGGAAPVIASTVAGLGAGIDGMAGLLRCGSGALGHILPVWYDAALAKWVSDVFLTGQGFGRSSGQGTTGTGYADVGVVNGLVFPWRIFDAAGLRPQFRMMTQGAATGTGTTTIRLAYEAGDSLGQFVAAVGIDNCANAFPNTTQRIVDSGWGDIAAGWTVKDIMRLRQQIANSTGGGGGQIDTPAVMSRWVSQ